MWAVRPKPIAATLEKVREGQRSGVRPVRGSVLSQNQWKVLVSTVSRNGSLGDAVATGAVVAGDELLLFEQANIPAASTTTPAATLSIRAATGLARSLVLPTLLRA